MVSAPEQPNAEWHLNKLIWGSKAFKKPNVFLEQWPYLSAIRLCLEAPGCQAQCDAEQPHVLLFIANEVSLLYVVFIALPQGKSDEVTQPEHGTTAAARPHSCRQVSS